MSPIKLKIFLTRLFLSCFSFFIVISFSYHAEAQNRAEKIIQLKNTPINPKSAGGQQAASEELKRGSLFWSTREIDGFGLWVEAEGPEQPLNDPAELQNLRQLIASSPIKNIYVQVFRNGRSWFPSETADQTPYDLIHKQGFDPLKIILEEAKKKEEPPKVHAWFNALRLGEDADAKVLKNLDRESVLVSSRGASLLDTKGTGETGCRPDAIGIWLNPADPRVSQMLINVFKDLMKNYPGIDGLHLDMIRRPFPYAVNEKTSSDCKGFVSLREYEESKQNAVNKLDSINQEDFESLTATNVVRNFKSFLKQNYSQIELSAAVLSNQRLATQNARQNWPQWLRDGLIDNVVTMTYTDDFERFKREVLAARDVGPENVQVGIGAWLMLDSPKMLANQVKLIKDNDMEGVVLFSYGNLSNPKGKRLYQTMKEELLK